MIKRRFTCRRMDPAEVKRIDKAIEKKHVTMEAQKKDSDRRFNMLREDFKKDIANVRKRTGDLLSCELTMSGTGIGTERAK